MAYHFGVFYRGAGIDLWVDCKNARTNALADPSTSKTVTLTDPEGTAILTAEALTKDSTGVYYHSYATTSASPTGRWVGYFTMTSGTRISIEKFTFDLETL